jgi:hypothetical protein
MTETPDTDNKPDTDPPEPDNKPDEPTPASDEPKGDDGDTIEMPDDADVPPGHEPEPQRHDGVQDDGRDPEPDE